MILEPSDRMQTIIERPYAGPREHRNAYAHLKHLHAQGKLPPFLDGTDDTLADYVNILGLKP